MTDMNAGYTLLWAALSEPSRQELREMAFSDEGAPYASANLADDLRRVTADHTAAGRRVPFAAVVVGWSESEQRIDDKVVIVSPLLEWIRATPSTDD